MRQRVTSPPETPPEAVVRRNVREALGEDVGGGDVTAALIPADRNARATVISRSPGVFCGAPWVREACAQTDADIRIDWHLADGTEIVADTALFTLAGRARSLLTLERTLLNFVQLLSGTATAARACVRAVTGTGARILDTRKTLPGLRAAQKYAVAVGGADNHRMGLFDAFLIKENHILAAGGVRAAILAARAAHPDLPLEVEVEDLAELEEALAAGPDIVMLDNFTVEEMAAAVCANDTGARLEASGGLVLDDLAAVARTGVDYISVGSITKDVTPLDLSMRFE